MLGVQTAAYAVSGRWLMFVLNAALLAVYALRHRRGTAYVDVTELVNTLRAHKKERIVRLCVCAGLLLLVIGRCASEANSRVRCCTSFIRSPVQIGGARPLGCDDVSEG